MLGNKSTVSPITLGTKYDYRPYTLGNKKDKWRRVAYREEKTIDLHEHDMMKPLDPVGMAPQAKAKVKKSPLEKN